MTERVSWGDGAYAGFWRRLVGMLIDGIILSAVSGGLAAAFAPPVLTEPIDPQTLQIPPGLAAAVAGWSLVGVVVFVAYETVMLSTLGWTLGKKVVGVEVRGADGVLLSVPRAIGRALGKYVSALPLYLGFLWAAWDRRKQAWHDKFVSSFALKSAALQPVVSPAVAERLGRTAQPSAEPAPQAWPNHGPWGIPAEERGEPPREDAGPAAPAAPPNAASVPDVGAPERQPPPEEPPRAEPPPAEPTPEEPPPAEPARHEPPPAEPARHEPPPAEPARDEPPPAEAPPEEPAAPADDPNLVAIARAGLASESAVWLQQVAGQVDARLDRVSPPWRSMAQADAARACAFGLLLGYLARLYPHMQGDLARVAEAHPSFSTLGSGNRLHTLQEIAGDPGRTTAWLGPLVGADAVEDMRRLFE